jgi:RNA polymerase-binding protein DksA
MPGQAESEPPEQAAVQPPTKPAAVKAPARKPRAPKPPAAKALAKEPPAAKALANEAPAKKAPVKETPEAKTPAAEAPAAKAAAPSAQVEVPSAAAQAPAASAWTEEELDGFRVALETDIVRLREELHMGEVDMADLLADSSDGAGDDQADAGSKTLEREQEMSVNANARELLDQSTHALRRLEAGTYGICESCGTVIPAARLRAFPRATLCIACKQAEERG